MRLPSLLQSEPRDRQNALNGFAALLVVMLICVGYADELAELVGGHHRLMAAGTLVGIAGSVCLAYAFGDHEKPREGRRNVFFAYRVIAFIEYSIFAAFIAGMIFSGQLGSTVGPALGVDASIASDAIRLGGLVGTMLMTMRLIKPARHQPRE